MKKLKRKVHTVANDTRNQDNEQATYREGDSGASEKEAKQGGYREGDTGTSVKEAKRGVEEKKPEKAPAPIIPSDKVAQPTAKSNNKQTDAKANTGGIN